MPLPTVHLASKGDIFAFEEADVALEGYRPHKGIKAPIAV
jgi:thymidylate synthase